jgi:hypothetical protein
MSCDRNGRRCADAARRNGISGYVSRYLNTITNWSTYQDLGRVEDIPQRMLDVTARFFGIMSDGRVRGVFALLIGTHLVEQITGALFTMAVRLAWRGKPFGRYRGITLRQSPLAPTSGRMQNVLLRGRVIESKGFYFHEAGRTWHCNVATYRVGDTPKTLTYIKSLSVPNREYFFDRELPPQDVVDLALGDKDPDTIPGYIGATNEIDGLLHFVRGIKHTMYFANWLLVDDTERDAGSEIVDYGGFGGGPARFNASSSPGNGAPSSPGNGWSGTGKGGYGGYRNPNYDDWGRSYRWYGPQVTATDRPASEGYGGPPEARDNPVDPGLFVGSLWDQNGNGHAKQTIQLRDGREVPLSIHSIQVTPDGRRLAEAYYYLNNQWWSVKDEGVREQLARDVVQGKLQTDDAFELWAR